MKTRLISVTLVILFAVVTVAEATNNRVKNSSIASRHENVIETNQLEGWITSRENWEQEGQETVSNYAQEKSSMLEEWIARRDNWEQEGQETVSDYTLKESSMLEKWIAGRESWEQEGQETVNDNVLVVTSIVEP
jgi:hypothetical protein